MKIQNIYKLFKEHPFVSTDTRNIKSNSLFFALKGENFDGNIFAQTAIASGAKFAIVDDPSFQVSNKHILVPNVLACLQELAAHHRKQLDIPIIGGETLNKRPYSLAEYISTRAIDMVRADVSWSGGITGTMKTAHLCESFGMQCEIHTAIFHPLELGNLHVCAAIKNCEYFELLVPTHLFNVGLTEDIQIENGMAKLPDKPGLGIDLDWDFIDNNTFKEF